MNKHVRDAIMFQKSSAVALAAAMAGSLFSFAPAHAVSDYQLRTAGDRSAPWCAQYIAEDTTSTRFGSNNQVHFFTCFNTKSQCDAWFFQVQSKYRNHRLRQPCYRR
ncbi:MAG: hypothetical protein AAF764_08375 [Pseudomonadota bacterium]